MTTRLFICLWSTILATVLIPPVMAATEETDETTRSGVTARATAAASGPEKTSTDPDPSQPDKDGWYTLFNGKDLSGWKVLPDNPETFKVEDGKIVVKGKVCHLYYDGPVSNANFKNFEWTCDVLTKPRANSGMYFHTKFQESGFPAHGIECQVNNSHRDQIRTGSIYKLSDIRRDSPAKDNEWFTQLVIVNGRHIIVAIDGKIVNDYIAPEKIEREEGWEKNILGSGTFALQGHDPGSEVHYKNIKVRPLP